MELLRTVVAYGSSAADLALASQVSAVLQVDLRTLPGSAPNARRSGPGKANDALLRCESLPPRISQHKSFRRGGSAAERLTAHASAAHGAHAVRRRCWATACGPATWHRHAWRLRCWMAPPTAPLAPRLQLGPFQHPGAGRQHRRSSAWMATAQGRCKRRPQAAQGPRTTAHSCCMATAQWRDGWMRWMTEADLCRTQPLARRHPLMALRPSRSR